MRKILVPLRYPITQRGVRTLKKALEAAPEADTVLIVYHINLLYEDNKITKRMLQREVEEEVPEVNALPKVTYSVENSYLLDESILKKISLSKIDTVIMGKSMVPRWRRFIKFWSGYKITDEIKKAADCKVIVVQ
ncbi:MAG: hypothetical protein V3T58_07690 [Candidatus Hydrothermarchaeales archaeon]